MSKVLNNLMEQSLELLPARSSLYLAGVAVVVLTLCTAPAFGYGLWKYSAGRDDQVGRFDLPGIMWAGPGPAGPGPSDFDFGQIGKLSGVIPNLTATQVETAAVAAANEWEKWGKVVFSDTLGTAGTGKVRLKYDSTKDYSAFTNPHTAGGKMDYLEISFGKNRGFSTQPDGTKVDVPWNAANFQAIMLHELGHVLGIDDMYTSAASYVEEFVDHPVAGNDKIQRPTSARQDNIMNGGWPGEVIDNDEIAAITWIWGGDYNQIVTGDLEDSWRATPDDGRTADYAHGDQAGNTLTWWDYRGTVVNGGGIKPWIELEFAGYERFLGTAYSEDGSAVDIVHWGNTGGDTERFVIDKVGWAGNFELMVKSQFSDERRIDAKVVGGRADAFNKAPNLNGLVFEGGGSWAQVFGPVPEPATLALLLMGAVALLKRRR